MKIRHPFEPTLHMMFFEEEGGGGGGGTAVIEMPSAPAPDPSAPDADIMDFTLPVVDLDPEPKETPKVDPKAKPVAKAPDKAAKPAEVKEPPVANLRRELETIKAERESLKAERDELKGRLEKGDPRLVESENALKAKDNEIKEARQKATDLEKRMAMGDPAVRAKLDEMDNGYNSEATKFYKSVNIQSGDVGQLVREYDALPFNTGEYRAAREAWEAKVNEALGGSEGAEHRNLGRTLDFIEKSHEYFVQRPKVEQDIQQNAFKLQHEARVGTYTKEQAAVKARIEKAKAIDLELRTSMPNHPKAVIDAYAEAIPEDRRGEFDRGIPEFVELVMLGPKPRGEADYTGMSPAQIQQSQVEDVARYNTARERLPDVLVNGLRAMRLFPTLMEVNRKLRARLKEDQDAMPPDPTVGNGEALPGQSDDLAHFQKPAIPRF